MSKAQERTNLPLSLRTWDKFENEEVKLQEGNHPITISPSVFGAVMLTDAVENLLINQLQIDTSPSVLLLRH